MRRRYTLGDLFKSMFTGLADFVRSLLRIFIRLIVYMGLWLPGLYAVLGVILYYGADFHPFDFGTYSILYLSGGVACVICAVIIAIKNALDFLSGKKRERVSLSRKKRAEEESLEAQKREEYLRKKEEERSFRPKEREDLMENGIEPFDEKKEEEKKKASVPTYLMQEEWFDEDAAEEEEWIPVKESLKEEPKVVSAPKAELIDVYVSKLYPNVLVREYTDRFELYRMYKDDGVKHIGTEYKTSDR